MPMPGHLSAILVLEGLCVRRGHAGSRYAVICPESASGNFIPHTTEQCIGYPGSYPWEDLLLNTG